MMTAQTTERNGRLERLAKCQKIQPFQAGDDDLLCANDLIALLPTIHGFVHDPAEIRRLREAATGWPK